IGCSFLGGTIVAEGTFIVLPRTIDVSTLLRDIAQRCEYWSVVWILRSFHTQWQSQSGTSRIAHRGSRSPTTVSDCGPRGNEGSQCEANYNYEDHTDSRFKLMA